MLTGKMLAGSSVFEAARFAGDFISDVIAETNTEDPQNGVDFEKSLVILCEKTTKNICFAAMFAAMIFGLTMLHVPIGAGGYIHVGDAVIYVTAMLMGGPWAFISAAIGAACADIVSGFAVYAVPSAIIKILIAVPFVLISKSSPSFCLCVLRFLQSFQGLLRCSVILPRI